MSRTSNFESRISLIADRYVNYHEARAFWDFKWEIGEADAQARALQKKLTLSVEAIAANSFLREVEPLIKDNPRLLWLFWHVADLIERRWALQETVNKAHLQRLSASRKRKPKFTKEQLETALKDPLLASKQINLAKALNASPNTIRKIAASFGVPLKRTRKKAQ